VRPCLFGRHQADAYLHVPVGDYIRLIAAHLDDPNVGDSTETGLYLCYAHLNVWLDIADDDVSMEPTLVAFEAPPNDVRLGDWAWWSQDANEGYGHELRYGRVAS